MLRLRYTSLFTRTALRYTQTVAQPNVPTTRQDDWFKSVMKSIRRKDYTHALNIFQQKSIFETSVTRSNAVLTALAKAERYQDLENLGKTLAENNVNMNISHQNLILYGMCRRNTKAARLYFDKMDRKEYQTYATMIRAYVAINNAEYLSEGFALIKEQIKLFGRAHQNSLEKLFVWNVVRRDMLQAAQVVHLAQKHNIPMEIKNDHPDFAKNTQIEQFDFRKIVEHFAQHGIPYEELIQVVKYFTPRELYDFEKQVILRSYVDCGHIELMEPLLETMNRTFSVYEILMEEYMKKGNRDKQKLIITRMVQDGIIHGQRRVVQAELEKLEKETVTHEPSIQDSKPIVDHPVEQTQTVKQELIEREELTSLKEEGLALWLLESVGIDPKVGSIRGQKAWPKVKLDQAFEMLQQLDNADPAKTWTRKQFNYFIVEAGKVAKNK